MGPGGPGGCYMLGQSGEAGLWWGGTPGRGTGRGGTRQPAGAARGRPAALPRLRLRLRLLRPPRLRRSGRPRGSAPATPLPPPPWGSRRRGQPGAGAEPGAAARYRTPSVGPGIPLSFPGTRHPPPPTSPGRAIPSLRPGVSSPRGPASSPRRGPASPAPRDRHRASPVHPLPQSAAWGRGWGGRGPPVWSWVAPRGHPSPPFPVPLRVGFAAPPPSWGVGEGGQVPQPGAAFLPRGPGCWAEVPAPQSKGGGWWDEAFFCPRNTSFMPWP